jgi:hypothetical protein
MPGRFGFYGQPQSHARRLTPDRWRAECWKLKRPRKSAPTYIPQFLEGFVEELFCRNYFLSGGL